MRALLFVSLITLGFSMSAMADATKPAFPSIQSQNLNGDNMRLPEDFQGEVNLVIFAFKRNQQAVVDTWLPSAADLAKRFQQFDYYELPAVGPQPGFMKSIIDNGMRSGIQDTGTRGRTITLYVPKAPLMAALDMKSDRTIYLMLLDRQNRVIWRSEGPATKTGLNDLAAAVAGAI